MSDKSSIEWTDSTDNIIVAVQGGWWCRKISPGCTHCYAETVNDNDYFKGNHLKYAGSPPPLKLREDIIAKWKRQTKPRKHFVMSMSDVFGDWVPQSWIFKMLDGMAAAPRQIFQVLTKRADIMRREVLAWLKARGLSAVPRNIWLGVTVEDRKHGLTRIEEVRGLPAIIFLSCEPLLEDLGDVDLTGISWVICGGESGKRARPMHPDWPRSLRDQCVAAGVPFFFKQWGEWLPGQNDPHPLQSWGLAHHQNGTWGARKLPKPDRYAWWSADGVLHRGHRNPDDPNVAVWAERIGKKNAGRLLDGREWNEFPATSKPSEEVD